MKMLPRCVIAKRTLWLATAVASLMLPPSNAIFAQGGNHRSRPGEVILKFRGNTPGPERSAILSDLGAAEVRDLTGTAIQHARITKLGVNEAIARYRNHPRIEFIEPNYVYEAFRNPNDPRFNEQWSLRNTGQTGGLPGADTDATLAWDTFTGSRSVLVAIIDSGIDLAHPDLSANIFVNPGEIPGNNIDDDANGFVDDVRGWNFVNNTNNASDDVGHGTHVSGTAGAVGNNAIGVAGLNWDVQILPIKFLDAFGSGTTAAAVASIQYAILMGSRVINASWGGGGPSEALRQAIAAADLAGILFVAAAGNSGSNNDIVPQYPANFAVPNIIAVAASDHLDRLPFWSNFGPTTVHLAAPGVDILSTLPSTYGLASGTSMAAPHVTGALGLVFGRFPSITGADAKALLLSKVDVLPNLNGAVLTGGRLNVWLPIAEPDSIPPAAIGDLATADPNGTRVTLNWTATGDDGSVGTASRYAVRYSTSPIDDTNFASAQLAAGAPVPKLSGTAEEMQVQGLDFLTTYYFAVKALDEFGNASPVTISASATTLAPPEIAVTPLALSAALLTGETTTRILTVSNSGEAEMHYELDADAALGVEMRQGRPRGRRYRSESTPHDSEAVSSYPPSQEAYVGDRTAPRATVFPWQSRTIDLQSANRRLLLLESGGDVSEIQTLLASFPDVDVVDVFHGQTMTPTLANLMAYDAVIVAVNRAFGDPVTVGNVLADYVDSGGGVVLTLASFIGGWEIQGRFLAEGYMPFALGSGPIGASVLGDFDADHPIMTGVTTATGDLLGAVNLSGDSELVASWTNSQPFVATKGNVAAVNIYVGNSGYWTGDIPLVLHNAAFWSSGALTWLSTDPESGVLPAGEQIDVVVTFDASSLDGGDYAALLLVRSDDPDEGEIAVTVQMDVTGAPDLVVFGEEAMQESAIDYFANGARTVHSLPATAPAAGGGTIEILAEGDYGDASETATLSVEGTTLGAAGAVGSDCVPASRRFVLTPEQLSALIVDGQVDAEVQNTIGVNVFCVVNRHMVTLRYPTPADHMDFGALFLGLERELALTVTNVGSDVLEMSSITTDVSEFVPSAASLMLLPRTSARLAVRFQPSAVATFTGTLTIVSNDPGTPVVTVALSGAGQHPPIIGVQPSSLASTLVEGAQQTQTLTISNSGQSALEFDLQIGAQAPGVVHSSFAGLSSPIAGASNNSAPQESAPIHEEDIAAGEPRFLAAPGDFELMQPSPVSMTCVVEDRSANILYAQQDVGNSFYRYRALTNVWEPLANAPLFSGNNGGAALLNGKIYTSYTANVSQLGVYDIASNSWSTRANPLGQGTADIASDGAQFLYLVVGFSLVRLDPATGVMTQLASPPFYFEPWGGLRHLNGVLYGHQGNGARGFAKYDVASNTWTPLPNVPGGAVLGAVIDPVAIEYVAYGDYFGNNLYRFSIRAGTWTVVTIPFFTVGDGGMGWLAAPVPAVYFVEGERGTGLARTVTLPQFLSLTPTTGTVPPLGSLAVDVLFDTGDLFGGVYRAEIQVASNDPVTPQVVVPAMLTVIATPDIAIAGDAILVESAQDYTTLGAATAHVLPVTVSPGGGGTLELVADGDYGDTTETATATVEGTTLGSAGGVFGDCLPASASFPLSAAQLENLIADGQVDVDVQNSAGVDVFCTVNRHTVRLRYTGSVDPLDFGPVFVGAVRELSISVFNHGSESLQVNSITTDSAEFTPAVGALVIGPRSMKSLAVLFEPAAAIPFSGTLTLQSNDPDEAAVTVALQGRGLVPPEIDVSPTSVSASLFTGQKAEEIVTIQNTGGSDLEFEISVEGNLPGALTMRMQDPHAVPSGTVSKETSAVIHRTAIPPTVGVPKPIDGRPEVATGPEESNPGPLRSDLAPENYTWQPLGFSTMSGATVLLLQDNAPWGSMANEQVLGANSIAFDMIPSSALATTDLSRYRLVIVPSDQPTSYYSRLVGRAAQLNEYVSDGGVLEFHAAGWGHANGDASLVTLPEGMRISSYHSSRNDVLDPSHPLMAGVPDPFFGSYASHAYFSNVPASAAVLAADELGRPNLVVYGSGSGLVIAGGQTFEYGYVNNQDAGRILRNMIPFVNPSADWLQPQPLSGRVPAGGSLEIVVTLDASGLRGGEYDGTLVVQSNDLDEPEVAVQAHLSVTGAPDVMLLGELQMVESTQNYQMSGATTTHALPVTVLPEGDGTLELVAQGDYGDVSETATVRVEDLRLGEVGRVGSDCLTASGAFPIAAPDLARLVADGIVGAEVQNSSAVDAFCAQNSHTVRLLYRRAADTLDFESLFVGACRSRTFAVTNTGTEPLSVTEVATSHPDVTVDAASFTVGPGATRQVMVTFCPSSPGVLTGTLTIRCNDPDEAEFSVALHGEGLVPPVIDVSPRLLSVDLFTGEQATEIVTIQNTGGSALEFEISFQNATPASLLVQVPRSGGAGKGTRDALGLSGAPRDAVVLGRAAEFVGKSVLTPPGQVVVATGSEAETGPPRSDRAPTDYVHQPLGFSRMAGATALLIQDLAPWGTAANEAVLADNGIAFDMIPSSAIASTDLSAYALVIVPSDQPTSYYSRLGAQATQLNEYVSDGGTLEFHAAAWGFAGGDASIVTLPEGMRINFYYSDRNDVLDPSHPLVAGVPDPFFGTSASHSYFSSVPAGAILVAADDLGRPNLVIYDSGRGRVIAGGQTFEFGYANDQDAGLILRNMIPFAYRPGPMWLSAEPLAGTVPAGETLEIMVLFDATGLNGGDYDGLVVVESNDPIEPAVEVAAHMHVTGAPDVALLGELQDVESTRTFQVPLARTTHELPVTVSPGGDGTIELVAQGDYGFFGETATITVEGMRLGDVGGNVGTDCAPASGTFTIASVDLERLVADGVVNAEVQNSGAVDLFCAENSHTVRLRYRSSADEMDFGALFVGLCRSRTLEVSNTGTDVLTVSELTSDHPDVTVQGAGFALAPGASQEVVLTFCPTTPGLLTAALTVRTNDPDEAELSVALRGEGLVPPEIAFAPQVMNEDLVAGETSTRILQIANSGGSPLTVSLALQLPLAQGMAGTAATKADPGPRDRQLAEHTDNDPSRYLESYRIHAATGGQEIHEARATDQPGKATQDLPRLDATVIFEDDMESGPNGWSHTSTHPNGVDLWRQTTVRASSGTTSWNVAQHAFEGGDALMTPPIDLAGFFQAALTFDHYYDFDDCGTPTFDPDGGIVEVSTDGGANWQQIFPVGGYPYILDDICGNPLAFYQAYSHSSSGAFVQALFDLSPFAGKTLHIRFHAGWDCGNCGFNEGWYIDDVSVTSLTPRWISVSPREATIAPQGVLDVQVDFNATALAVGSYDAQLVVASNDPDEPSLVIPVNLQVWDVAGDLVANPETVNLGRNGQWITSYVEFPSGLDVANVIVSTVRFNRDAPADVQNYSIGDQDEDGVPDLTLKFGMQAVRQTLTEGDEVPVIVTGEMLGGMRFLTEDIVRVIRHGVTAPNGGERLAFGEIFAIEWSVPHDWEVHHADLTYSLDGGIAWHAIATGVAGTSFAWSVPQVTSQRALVRVTLFDDAGMIAFDSCDGVFEIQNIPSAAERDAQVESRVALQNGPNPFKAGTFTTITFQLPRPAQVSLKVYDVAGNLVRTLREEWTAAGRHFLGWDGLDNDRRQVAAGIYFCRLRVEDTGLTRRMLVLR